jgi:hypothetical protein
MKAGSITAEMAQSPTHDIKTIPTTPVGLKRAIPEALPISFDFKGFHLPPGYPEGHGGDLQSNLERA